MADYFEFFIALKRIPEQCSPLEVKPLTQTTNHKQAFKKDNGDWWILIKP